MKKVKSYSDSARVTLSAYFAMMLVVSLGVIALAFTIKFHWIILILGLFGVAMSLYFLIHLNSENQEEEMKEYDEEKEEQEIKEDFILTNRIRRLQDSYKAMFSTLCHIDRISYLISDKEVKKEIQEGLRLGYEAYFWADPSSKFRTMEELSLELHRKYEALRIYNLDVFEEVMKDLTND